MPQADYSLLRPTTTGINTPFENLGAIMALRNQQQAGQALAEQRQSAAEKNRQEVEARRQEEAAAAQVRSLFGRPNQPPTPEELAAVVGPDAATKIFSGFEALRKAQWANQDEARADVASVLNAVTAFPTDDLRAKAYKGARESLIQQGKLKPEDAPEDYSPDFVKNALMAALSPEKIAELNKPQAPIHVGDALVDPKTLQPVYTAPPKPAALGSFEDFAARYAKQRNLKPEQLSAGDIAKAKAQYEAAGRAPTQATKPTYEWAQTAEGTRLLTPEEIRAQGATKPIAATDKGKYQNAEPVLAAVAELSEKINTGEGLLAKMGGGAAKLAAKANYDDDVAEYQALVEGFTPLMARALGHTGVLTQQDVESVKALFPQPGNSKTLRDRKIARIRDIFKKLEGVDSGTAPAAAATPPADAGRVRVRGPNGETGTMPASSALPPGWSKIGG